MIPKPVTQEAESLREQIARANRAYYELDAPELSDEEYDLLFRRLQALETAYPALATADSPTRRVGGTPATHLPRHVHLRPMLSLANAFSDEELAAWEQRNARLAPSVPGAGYTLEVKIDGTAVCLTYANGTLVTGATRGNGAVGEDVTANLRTIDDIPLALRGDGWPALMEVRGEVYFPTEAFRKLNLRREREGEPPFANPRNAAAGALRQLDPATTRSRRLRCFAFQVVPIEGTLTASAHHEVLATLEQWGFKVEPHHARSNDLAGVIRQIEALEELLPSLPFGADGVVVKVDPRELQEALGTISDREPRWAIARKFAPDVGVTRLLDIRVNVGRTGALAPYAVLEPVELAGVTITSATLHNDDVVAQKDVRVGDWVEVIRAGEVIPKVVGPVRERRDGSEVPWIPPDRCPGLRHSGRSLPRRGDALLPESALSWSDGGGHHSFCFARRNGYPRTGRGACPAVDGSGAGSRRVGPLHAHGRPAGGARPLRQAVRLATCRGHRGVETPAAVDSCCTGLASATSAGRWPRRWHGTSGRSTDCDARTPMPSPQSMVLARPLPRPSGTGLTNRAARP